MLAVEVELVELAGLTEEAELVEQAAPARLPAASPQLEREVRATAYRYSKWYGR